MPIDMASPRNLKILKIISANHSTQTFLARCKKTNLPKIVKTTTDEAESEFLQINDLLTESFKLQQTLYCCQVVTAQRIHQFRGKSWVVYPFLSERDWQTLTIEHIIGDPKRILGEMILLMDFLHSQGLVHGDLKISNFMISINRVRPTLRLVDLDFLTKTRSKTAHRLIGTPELMAPEIEYTEELNEKTDIFSLGKSLLISIEERENTCNTQNIETVESIRKFSSSLTNEKPFERPTEVAQLLLNERFVDGKYWNSYQSRLLLLRISTAIRPNHSNSLESMDSLRKVILEKTGIINIPPEIVHTLIYSESNSNLSKTLLQLLRFVSRCKITKLGNHFSIDCEDDEYYEFFTKLGIYNNSPLQFGKVDRLEHEIDFSTLEKYSESLKSKGFYLCSYVFLKKLLYKMKKDYPSRLAIIESLGLLARSLNRYTESVLYFEQVLSHEGTTLTKRVEIAYQLAGVLLQLGENDDALVIINKYTKEQLLKLNAQYFFLLLCLKAWVLRMKSDVLQAHSTLEFVLDECGTEDLVTPKVEAMYSKSVSLAYESKFEECIVVLESTINISKSNELIPSQIRCLSLLAQMNHELGRYRVALKISEEVIRLASKSATNHRSSSACLAIAHASIRLGDFKNAENWLMRFLYSGSMETQQNNLATYSLASGFLELNRGNLRKASDLLMSVLALPREIVTQKTIGKVYHNLAELCLMRGEVEQCKEFVSKGKSVFSTSHDHPSSIELDAILVFNKADYSESSELVSIFQVLNKNHCMYFSDLCLLRILLNSDENGIKNLEIREDKSSTPVNKAIRILLKSDQKERSSHISALKEAFNVLIIGEQKYLALLVCSKICDHYEAELLYTHLRKFQKVCMRLANELGNREFASRYEIQTHGDYNQSRSVPVTLVHKISEILTDITDMDHTLNNLLRFAVEQTGAERGVLLLKDPESGEMYSAARLHCDHDTALEVEEFSRTIPSVSIRDLEPIMIENALTDKRTKKLESIVAHHIKSVACIPLTVKNKLMGALYLDHHTIPALFNPDDFLLFKAISNFIAITLETSDSFLAHVNLNKHLMRNLANQGEPYAFITEHPPLLELLSSLPLIAQSSSPVLIEGESGTGKEILCSLIHHLSTRKDKEMVMLNCAAIASTLIEAELFGIARGVATGVGHRIGKFKSAHESTMFLDEIGDMPKEVQAKVLRVLEYQTFEEVGSNRKMKVDVRFVCATNRNLKKMVAKGEFREDLFYRINVFVLDLPPLRERLCDVPLLLDHFLNSKASPPIITSEAMNVLMSYKWPGNVRELRNFAERYSVLFAGKRIQVSDLPEEFKCADKQASDTDSAFFASEKKILLNLFERYGRNQTQTAEHLNIPASTLRYKLKKFGII